MSCPDCGAIEPSDWDISEDGIWLCDCPRDLGRTVDRIMRINDYFERGGEHESSGPEG